MANIPGPQQIGLLVGGSGGLAFVVANGQLLGPVGQTASRVLAVLAFVALIVLVFRGQGADGNRRADRDATADAGTGGGAGFGPAYWAIVAGEVVAGLGGLFVLVRVLGIEAASLGWIALVVGVHFVVLGRVWREPSIAIIGAALSVLGAIGLVLALTGAGADLVAFVSGFLSGIVLLGATLAAAALPRRVGSPS